MLAINKLYRYLHVLWDYSSSTVLATWRDFGQFLSNRPLGPYILNVVGILISFEVEEEIEQCLELLSPHGQRTQPQINFLVNCQLV